MPKPGATRRRLWQLPPELRGAVVGLSLAPPLLRRTAEQVLARLHGRPVELLGSDAEVLASVLCDLGTRNPLSEAVQRELAARHAVGVARCGSLRSGEALRAAWARALAGGDVPGTAWALLTHPMGPELEAALRVDLQGWTWQQARESQAQCQDAAQKAAALREARGEADALRLRLQQAQAALDHERRVAAAERAQLHRALAAAQSAPPPCHAAAPHERQPAKARDAGLGAMSKADAAAATAAPEVAAPEAPAHVAVPIAPPLPLRGRRVLCVGGMPGAQDRYRRLVETAGAHFDFHDGGLEQSLHRLDHQLGAADLVVCQAGCLNHEAYRRVKGYCRRADKTCLFVERPSLAHFARTLGLAAGAAA
jgi:hypothetical protein